jgi:hypothetical protein
MQIKSKKHKMIIVKEKENEWKCAKCARYVVLDLTTDKFVVKVRGNEKFVHEISPNDYEPLDEFPQEELK